MKQASQHRPRWDIDRRLTELIGQDVRVSAKSFSPLSHKGAGPLRFVPVRDLFLPDNTQPAGLTVFFEGRLQQFERQVGVAFVRLRAPKTVAGSPEGIVCFRGTTAAIVRGPAVVELAFPFHLERMPVDPHNYWRDLQMPRVQFELSFMGDSQATAEHLTVRPISSPCHSAKLRWRR